MGSMLVLGRSHISQRISWWTTHSELVWQNYSHPYTHGSCFTTKETTTLRNRVPHNYRVALTRLQQTEDHTAQKTHYRPKTKTSPSSLWALQLHWRVLYISHVQSHVHVYVHVLWRTEPSFREKKNLLWDSQTLNICFLTELSPLESFPNPMNGVAPSLSLWQLTCDHTVDTFPLIWIFAISTSFSTIQGSSSLCHKNGDNIQIRNRNSYSQVMPHTVASSRVQPLLF